MVKERPRKRSCDAQSSLTSPSSKEESSNKPPQVTPKQPALLDTPNRTRHSTSPLTPQQSPSNSRSGSNNAKSKKSIAPSTTLHNFFKSSIVKPKLTKYKENVQPTDNTNNSIPQDNPNYNKPQDISALELKVASLQESLKDKEEQLKTIQNNRSMVYQNLKSALDQRDSRIEELESIAKERQSKVSSALEQLLREQLERQDLELRETVARDTARLGRFVYKGGYSKMETWEHGHAAMQLKTQRKELADKREALEQRLKDAKRAAKRLEGMPPPDTPKLVVGGLEILNDLDAMEAEESAKFHLSELKAAELKLAQDERALNDEIAAHVRNMKRVANEDASRFGRLKPLLNQRYLPMHILGKGGFSEVWQAYDLQDLREVAVKIHQVDPRWSDSKRESYTKHVSREYQIHRHVRHARIVSLFDVFEIDQHSFATVLECCKGTDLDTLLKQRKVLAERDARAILLQILDGMRYLSSGEQPIIHYDLKPGNILFDSQGDAKITDFGLSKIVDNSSDSMELTSQGAGTYWYLPPECFATHSAIRISNKVDVWSIGVIYYQMLFGRRPFGDGHSQEAVFANHAILHSRQVKFPPKPICSAEAREFIQVCLTYDQAFRPTIAELCQHSYLFQKKVS